MVQTKSIVVTQAKTIHTNHDLSESFTLNFKTIKNSRGYMGSKREIKIECQYGILSNKLIDMSGTTLAYNRQ